MPGYKTSSTEATPTAISYLSFASGEGGGRKEDEDRRLVTLVACDTGECVQPGGYAYSLSVNLGVGVLTIPIATRTNDVPFVSLSKPTQMLKNLNLKSDWA